MGLLHDTEQKTSNLVEQLKDQKEFLHAPNQSIAQSGMEKGERTRINRPEQGCSAVLEQDERERRERRKDSCKADPKPESSSLLQKIGGWGKNC